MLLVRARRRELILSTKHTLDYGFSNCSTPTTNGSTSIAYWYGVLINKVANVRITWYWGTFVQLLLQWKSNKYWIFWVCKYYTYYTFLAQLHIFTKNQNKLLTKHFSLFVVKISNMFRPVVLAIFRESCEAMFQLTIISYCYNCSCFSSY
jgi:hypothetical protein